MGRIGIYGGTFNPPHLGHIRAAKAAAESLRLDKLLLIPSYISPHKKLPEGSADPQQRLHMLCLGVKGDPVLQPSDLELKREDVSFTYQTVLQLREMYPEDRLILLMGTDMFCSFLTWRYPEIIMENAALGVFCRGEPGEKEAIASQKETLSAMGAEVFLIEHPITAISSTDLRRMLVFGCADPFLPEGVGDYIRQTGLYGTSTNYRDLSEEELENAVKGLLKPGRVPHVLGCRDTARQLARRWGCDETDAVRAALLHDITKALDGPLQLTLCSCYDIILDTFGSQNPKTLHALTGSYVAQRIFGENPAVVAAIRSHTTGKPNMNTLEKIIYVADYMEPNRDFPGVEKLRSLAWEDLDAALQLGLEMTIDMLHSQGRTVSSESEEALAWLKMKNVP